jgi:hypothetical protein
MGKESAYPVTGGIGTEEQPLIHPVTGERIIFRKRARDQAAASLGAEPLINEVARYLLE